MCTSWSGAGPGTLLAVCENGRGKRMAVATDTSARRVVVVIMGCMIVVYCCVGSCEGGWVELWSIGDLGGSFRE